MNEQELLERLERGKALIERMSAAVLACEIPDDISAAVANIDAFADSVSLILSEYQP